MALGNWYSSFTQIRKIDDKWSYVKDHGNIHKFDNYTVESYKNWLTIRRDGNFASSMTIGSAQWKTDSGTIYVQVIPFEDKNVVHKMFIIYHFSDDITTISIGSMGYGYRGDEWYGFGFEVEFEFWHVYEGLKEGNSKYSEYDVWASMLPPFEMVKAGMVSDSQAMRKYGWTIGQMVGTESPDKDYGHKEKENED